MAMPATLPAIPSRLIRHGNQHQVWCVSIGGYVFFGSIVRSDSYGLALVIGVFYGGGGGRAVHGSQKCYSTRFGAEVYELAT